METSIKREIILELDGILEGMGDYNFAHSVHMSIADIFEHINRYRLKVDNANCLDYSFMTIENGLSVDILIDYPGDIKMSDIRPGNDA